MKTGLIISGGDGLLARCVSCRGVVVFRKSLPALEWRCFNKTPHFFRFVEANEIFVWLILSESASCILYFCFLWRVCLHAMPLHYTSIIVRFDLLLLVQMKTRLFLLESSKLLLSNDLSVIKLCRNKLSCRDNACSS